MTLAEILKVGRLPMRFLRGDEDHEDTTQALDEAVLAARRLEEDRALGWPIRDESAHTAAYEEAPTGREEGHQAGAQEGLAC